MGDVFLFFLICNSVIFSFIFWILTVSLKFFYYDKYSNYKLDFYECGFKSITSIKIQIPMQFILIAVFLLIYDAEFLLLYPAFFNLFYLTFLQILVLFVFCLLLFITIYLDYIYTALDWYV